mmetsp:Transcript_56091/g.154566  ORF Transcript_56091/g.154566 Transcript_56091/m.154566 type:complete len:80 (+) Transcript_56091:966-1205(+)
MITCTTYHIACKKGISLVLFPPAATTASDTFFPLHRLLMAAQNEGYPAVEFECQDDSGYHLFLNEQYQKVGSVNFTKKN